MQLSDLVHIDGEGWCILSEIIDVSLPDNEKVSYLPVLAYRLFTLAIYDHHPRRLTMPVDGIKTGHYKQHCAVRFVESDDSFDCSIGDIVFYMAPRSGRIDYGRVTKICKDENAIEVEGLLMPEYQIITFEHNFEQIVPSASVCKHCNALRTLPYKASA